MKRCKECGRIIEDDALIVVHDDPSPKGIALPSGSYTYTYCPHCGSDHIDDSFNLIDEIDLEEEDDTTVIVSFEGKSYLLYLDEIGELEMMERKTDRKETTSALKEVA